LSLKGWVLAARGSSIFITILECFKKTPLGTPFERLKEEETRSSESTNLEANRKIFTPVFE